MLSLYKHTQLKRHYANHYRQRPGIRKQARELLRSLVGAEMDRGSGMGSQVVPRRRVQARVQIRREEKRRVPRLRRPAVHAFPRRQTHRFRTGTRR